MHACISCGNQFVISDEERAFLVKMQFSFGSTKIDLPEPENCPECRLRLRTAHRNERFLYRRKSAKSGKDFVSLYHSEPVDPKRAYVIWDQTEWKADDFDPLVYGRAFDFSRPFFDQFAELQNAVPHMNLITVSNENSDFSTGTGYCKNCYLINSSEYCEDCYYGKLFQSCSDSCDCAYLFDSQICYECFSVYNSYNCSFLSFSKNCTDCSFGSALTNCKNCFLCTNLDRKEFFFENKQCTKEEYAKKIAEFAGSYSAQQKAKKKLQELMRSGMHRAANIVNSENVTGDYIESSRNCTDCYDMTDSEDCRYVTVGVAAKDCIDCSNMYVKPELCYQVLGTIEVYHVAYSLYVFHSQNILYSEYCYNSKDCFGCSGLTRKQYCILNTQFTKEQYEELVPKIIEHMKKGGEWGKYLPAHLSPFGYNETLASEYLPLKKADAAKKGFYWRDTKDEPLAVSKVISATDLPDTIGEVPDDVLNWAISCEVSGRPFRLQKAELGFYRRQNLSLPRLHPDVRYDERMAMRNPRKLFERQCAKCAKPVMSTYAPDRPETIYCEECYLKTTKS